MRKLILIPLISILLSLLALPFVISGQNVEENERLFVHLKTSFKHDDAQICVAYNIILAALKSNLAVDVLIDADNIDYQLDLAGRISSKEVI